MQSAGGWNVVVSASAADEVVVGIEEFAMTEIAASVSTLVVEDQDVAMITKQMRNNAAEITKK